MPWFGVDSLRYRKWERRIEIEGYLELKHICNGLSICFSYWSYLRRDQQRFHSFWSDCNCSGHRTWKNFKVNLPINRFNQLRITFDLVFGELRTKPKFKVGCPLIFGLYLFQKLQPSRSSQTIKAIEWHLQWSKEDSFNRIRLRDVSWW